MENTVFFDSSKKILTMHLKKFNDLNEYSMIERAIRSQYSEKEIFALFIETKDLKATEIELKYLHKFSCFLKELKLEKCPYLTRTTIHIYNEYTFNLIYILFTYLSLPIAKVNVILFQERQNNQDDISNIKLMKSFYP